MRRSDPNIGTGREGARKTGVANWIDTRRTGSLEQRGSKELLTMLREAVVTTQVGRIVVVVETHGKVIDKRTREVQSGSRRRAIAKGARLRCDATREGRWNHWIR
jgi:hypothetical protein